MQGENKSKEFSFKLYSKAIFIAELERDEKTDERINRILNYDMLKEYPEIDKTYSSAFKFLHWINQKGQDIVQKSFSIAPVVVFDTSIHSDQQHRIKDVQQ